MTIRAEYLDIVHYVSLKSSVSIYRTKKILSELSKNIKNRINEGYDLVILDMFKIKYKASKITDSTIYKNKIYDLDMQVTDIATSLSIDEDWVREVLLMYYTRINTLVRDGYKVSVKSVCVIEPTEVDFGDYSGSDRETLNEFKSNITISPVLCQCKADNVEFNILKKDGNIYRYVLPKENLRFEVIILKGLNRPSKKIEELPKIKQLEE